MYDAVMVGGRVVPGSSHDVTVDLSMWSVVVLPDEVVGPGGKLLHFAAFFVSTTPVYIQLWRPADNSSSTTQFVLAYNQKIYPRAVNQIETVSPSRCLPISNSKAYIIVTENQS